MFFHTTLKPGLIRALAAAGSLAFSLGAQAVPYVHVASTSSSSSAYIFDWRGSRAVVVDGLGRRAGNLVTAGAVRTVTLDAPLSQEYTGEIPSCGGEQPQMRQDITQFTVTRTSGTDLRGESSVSAAGTVTTLTGCAAGTVVPFGTDPSETAVATRHLAMSQRPTLTDLTTGTRLAGPSEEARPADSTFVAADVVTMGTGQVQFSATGNAYSTSITDNWLVVGLPGTARAYTRFSIDRSNGAEVWVDADWSGGLPQRVFQTLMVKVGTAPTFGSVANMSRIWESGLFIGSTTPFSIWLYSNLTGERVSLDPATGTESRRAITWSVAGTTLTQNRSFGPNAAVRRWDALRTVGATRWVMESENVVEASTGTSSVLIKPRVNFYVDRGATTLPAPTAR